MIYLVSSSSAKKADTAELRKRPELRKATDQMLLSYAVAKKCLDPIQNIDHERLGLVIGTSQGELETTKEFYRYVACEDIARPFLFQNSLHNSTAGLISQLLNIKGVVATVSDLCFSGESAIDLATTFLDSNYCDYCLVLGVDMLVPSLELAVATLFPPGLERGEGAGAICLSRNNVPGAIPLGPLKIERKANSAHVNLSKLRGYYSSNAMAMIHERSSVNMQMCLIKPNGAYSCLDIGQ